MNPSDGRMACESFQQQLRSEEHTSELQSQSNLVCRLLLENTKMDATPRRGARVTPFHAPRTSFVISSWPCALLLTSLVPFCAFRFVATLTLIFYLLACLVA